MPWNKVLSKLKAGELHSGSKTGPVVKSRAQGIAIMLSEKRAAKAGKSEYESKGEAAHETESTESKRKKAAEDRLGKGAIPAPKR